MITLPEEPHLEWPTTAVRMSYLTGEQADRYRRAEIVSSDDLRGIVGSGPADLDASTDAFDLLERIVAARLGRLHWPSATTSLAASPAVARCGSSHKVCVALPLQSAERLPAMAGAHSIEPAQPISRLGSRRCGLSPVS